MTIVSLLVALLKHIRRSMNCGCVWTKFEIEQETMTFKAFNLN